MPGVSRGGKSSKKPFQAVRGQHSLGYYATAEEAALTYARFIAQEERQEQIAGGGAPTGVERVGLRASG